VVEELLSNGAKLEELSKLVTNLKKLGLSDEIISRFAKSFGTDDLNWLRKARGLNLSSEVITNLSKLDGFADKMDEILELIKKSSRSADEVAKCIIKHGDKALDAIRKYGDDAVDAIVRHGDEATRVIGKYGDDAVDGLKQGKTPEEIEKELGGGGKTISQADRNKINSWLYTPSDELYLKYKAVFDNPKYFDQLTGEIHWPENDGFKDGTVINEALINKGTIFKRYGKNNGEFLGNAVDSFNTRALSPYSDGAEIHYYKLLEDYTMTRGEVAPWFGSPGGAEQFVKYKKMVKNIA